MKFTKMRIVHGHPADSAGEIPVSKGLLGLIHKKCKMGGKSKECSGTVFKEKYNFDHGMIFPGHYRTVIDTKSGLKNIEHYIKEKCGTFFGRCVKNPDIRIDDLCVRTQFPL